jgi:hypothetical protein
MAGLLDNPNGILLYSKNPRGTTMKAVLFVFLFDLNLVVSGFGIEHSKVAIQ